MSRILVARIFAPLVLLSLYSSRTHSKKNLKVNVWISLTLLWTFFRFSSLLSVLASAFEVPSTRWKVTVTAIWVPIRIYYKEMQFNYIIIICYSTLCSNAIVSIYDFRTLSLVSKTSWICSKFCLFHYTVTYTMCANQLFVVICLCPYAQKVQNAERRRRLCVLCLFGRNKR